MKMLEPIQISNLTVKNRIFFAPMAFVMDGFSDQARAYFERRAQGGTGMVLLNAVMTDALEDPGPMCCLTEENRDDLEKIIEAVHKHDCKFCIQMTAGLGRVGEPAKGLSVPLSPSENTAFFMPGTICQEITVEQIKDLQVGFRKTLEVLKTTSVDAVEFQAYGGYLIDQFLTPAWNRRTDEYGGSFENRTRFLKELIEIFKDVMGEDFPLIIKYCPEHYQEGEGYRTLENEGLQLSVWLEEQGAHMLHVDAGCYEQWPRVMPPTYLQEQVKQLRSSAAVKKVVTVPVATDGKLGNNMKGEYALQAGKCDALIIGRTLLSDPDFVVKAAEGRADEIRPCIGCNEGCLAAISAGNHMTCTVNPEVGYETTKVIKKTDSPKKVLVIGGGPAGMQAALDAKEAGHEVELWEKSASLGGMTIAAGKPDFKLEVDDLVNFFKLQMAKNRVPYKLSKEATEENVLAGGYDVVIMATGARPLIPNLPGIDGPNVVNGIDAMLDRATLGEHLAIIGGGLVGCELAQHLTQTRGKTVDLIEMQGKLLPEPVFIVNEMSLVGMVHSNPRITPHVGTKLVEIKEEGVIVEKDGKQELIPCDTAIISIGLRSNNALAEALKDKVDVRVIGDAIRPRHIIEATSEARDVVLAI